MILRFEIPHGEMSVYWEEFALKAGRSRVRKMLRLYARTWPEETERRQMRECLEELAVRVKEDKGRAEQAYQAAEEQVQVWEDRYRKLKGMRTEEYTGGKDRWKEEKAQAWEKLQRAKRARQDQHQAVEDRIRERKRCAEGLELMKEILGEESNVCKAG